MGRLQNDSNAMLTEQKTMISSIHDADLTLDIYFYVVSFLCCILLFFASWTSIQYLPLYNSYQLEQR